MERFTVRVVLAYRGDAFAGFVRQVGKETVEGSVLAAVQGLLPDVKGMAVGGRTDAGVHATGQVVSFWSRARPDLTALKEAIDGCRPEAIAALDVREVPRTFHAQFSARQRRYAYFLPDDGVLDAARLDRMVGALVGRRSFNAFARDTPKNAPMVRTMFAASARRASLEGQRVVRFDFCADGFLRRQIRVLVGTAVRELLLDAPDDALLRLAEAEDRAATAPPAEPGGLYLVRIGYDALMSYSRRGNLLRIEIPKGG
ncbi:MAG: hypothetical protein U1E65_28055 [Myxococcota bacterium]